MPDKQHEKSVFVPLSKVELQDKVDNFHARLKNEGEDFFDAVSELWLVEGDVNRYLSMDSAQRKAEYEAIFSENADSSYMEANQIRFLILFSLSGDDLEKIKSVLPECHARKDGFLNYGERVEQVERLLVQYLELCQRYYYSTYLSVGWNTLVPEDEQYSVLRGHAHVEPNTWFTEAAVRSRRNELMECDVSDLDKVARGLKNAEQRLLEYMTISTERPEYEVGYPLTEG